MEKVIFNHERNEYKLTLEVTNQFNDYKQHVYVAQLKLYSSDNLLIIVDNYIFPVLFERFKDLDLAFNFYLRHLTSRHDLRSIAYNLYLKNLNNNY